MKPEGDLVRVESNKYIDLSQIKLNKNGTKNWMGSMGTHLDFIYEDIQGTLILEEYDVITHKIKVKYKDRYYYFSTDKLLNCKLGDILKKRTREFKINIGQTFKDDKRDLTIIDREYRQSPYNKNTQLKYYKYHCNKCTYEGWAIEGDILGERKHGCSCCSGAIVVEGINDIPTTAPWMIQYFQGGYDEAKKYTYNSRTKIKPICSKCGRIKDKEIYIYSIYNNGSIGCYCGDRWTSFYEKFVCNILSQLVNKKQINSFIHQLTKQHYEWIGINKYDISFELNNEVYIIEVNGQQHLTKSFYTNDGRTLEEEQENDLNKKELAILNGIKPNNYIVLNFNTYEFEELKNIILNSRLNDIFNLNDIDWVKVVKNSMNKDMKKACKIKNDNKEFTTLEIGKIMNFNLSTISRWLKLGTIAKLCYYNIEEEKKIHDKHVGEKTRKRCSKEVYCLELDKYFSSATELSRKSKEIFGFYIAQTTISRVCLGKLNSAKGYHFKYTTGQK